MKTIELIFAIAIIALSMTCQSAPAQNRPEDAKKVAGDSNQFATDLLAQLSTSQKGNLFFSPYSIETALAMTSAGAAGQTAQQMNRTLHLDLPGDRLHHAFGALSNALNDTGDNRPFELVVANALWMQKGFDINPRFIANVKDSYHAQLDSLDFASSDPSLEEARKAINAWVEKQTHEKIKDLMPPGSVTRSTRLVLTNAIYFKSNWEEPFHKDQTRDEPFHQSGSSSPSVPTMHRTHGLPYMENEQWQAVELAYSLNRLSMVVLLPKKLDGLGELMKSLSIDSLNKTIDTMQDRQVELSLPKFTFSSHLSLASTLAAMGMPDAFDERADFSGISSGSKLYIQDVIHQAFVAVDEEGTEAAAATGVAMGLMAMRPPEEKVVFRADHPFLFLIRDRASGTILFMGRVMNPMEQPAK